MDNEIVMIIYIMVYRLAIIVSGILCIVVGYKLSFNKDLSTTEGSGKLKISKMEFIFKKVAPGTLFAAFGIIIISTMTITGGPEYSKTRIIETKNEESIITEETTIIRSSKYLELLKKGREYERNEKFQEAIVQYQKAINEGMKLLTGLDWLLYTNLDRQVETNISKQIKNKYNMAVKNSIESINALAWMYTKNPKFLEKGLILARIAVKISPEKANYIDTLAELLFQKGEYIEALKMKEMAINKSKAEYKSIYSKGLEKFKNAIKINKSIN